MENIGYIHAASVYEAPESIEVVPFRFDLNIFAELNQKNLSSFTAMRLLSIAVTLFCLNTVGQALAIEKYGNKGSEVTAIQKCLKNNGYFNASITGYYGSITKNAVTKFQQDNGLKADGVVGSKTQKTLQAKCSSQKSLNKQIDIAKLGNRSQAIKQLQQDLKQLNYFVGKPTGYFGPITKDAVIKFQKDKGLTADGIVGSTTLAAIKQSLKTANNIGGEKFTLRLDSRGTEVASLQKRLKELNYFRGKATGYFGPYTRDVVISFQKDNKLTADGIVGVTTQQTIDRAIARKKPVVISQSNVEPLTVGACRNGRCPTIRRGDRGRYVRYLQTRLRDWGYFKGNLDGNYNSQTAEAVKRFQKAKGMFPDGAVGPQTWQKIETPNKCNRPRLQRGDQGECVAKLQKRLNELDYLQGNSTAYFGKMTWEAVKEFQRNSELPPNGIVDVATWKALERSGSSQGESQSKTRYLVIIPVTSPFTLDEVRRIVPDAFVRDSRLGKYIQVGEFKERRGAQRYSRSFNDRGFDARVIVKK